MLATVCCAASSPMPSPELNVGSGGVPIPLPQYRKALTFPSPRVEPGLVTVAVTRPRPDQISESAIVMKLLGLPLRYCAQV